MKRVHQFCFSVWLIFLASVAAAQANQWTGAGPGDTAAQPSGAEFTYSITRDDFDAKRWTYSAIASQDSVITLEYEYRGYHAFFAVEVFLDAFVDDQTNKTVTHLVDDGPVNCCTSPSGGFTYTGSHTFNVAAGDEYGWEMGGTNSDSDNRLQGTFKILEPLEPSVPVPTLPLGVLLALVGLAGLLGAHRLMRISRGSR